MSTASLIAPVTIPAGVDLSRKYTDFASCTKNADETIEAAYHKITNISGNESSITITVGVFVSPTDTKKIYTEIFIFTPSTVAGADNFIEQAYTYLKTLDAFKTATTVSN